MFLKWIKRFGKFMIHRSFEVPLTHDFLKPGAFARIVFCFLRTQHMFCRAASVKITVK